MLRRHPRKGSWRAWLAATVAAVACPVIGSVGLRTLQAGPPERAADQETLEFHRDVRSLLAENCFHCHGPDANQRQADLRLDDRQHALADRPGGRILAAGDPDNSELYRRVSASEPSLRMPPPESNKSLTSDQIQLLRRWIEQGARWDEHWAFVPPQRPEIPEVLDANWPRNAIDHFVLKRLEEEPLRPSPAAEKTALIRRATLDLTGLSPTPQEVDAFLADSSPGAYEKVVDRLLASPAYGERMAMEWLDAARYADSGGYQGDILRSMWPWREWVIEAFNRNMPYDRFTVEQLAGDLLPNPTQQQRIATGFNRNHRINDEDGIIPEEFRVEYVVDRVETTATIWLGLTMGCARCHTHKYDPLTQTEFYQFFAFFNNVAEQGRGHGNSPPLLPLLDLQQRRRLAEIDSRLAALQGEASAADRAALQRQKDQLVAANSVMVMEELDQPRQTRVLIRGAYDQPAEAVSPAVPHILPPMPADAPMNRLGLAQWLVDPSHPLTARVTVNRFWQMAFGVGIVGTPEDFGFRGEAPSHPELLDYLARDFIRSGWDVKRLLRKIMTSATYRQSQQASPEWWQRDPDNRLLARGPRFRLAAEIIRDQALAASGLLVRQIGGPSVRPYQPAGLWKELASAHRDYGQSTGAGLYRRSLYTFWRRTIPPPSLVAFDAPNRDLCLVRRPRTNTPLQALVLMNDPTYVEASRALALRVLRQVDADADAASRISRAFRLLVGRRPNATELRILTQAFDFYSRRYADHPEAAQQFLGVGESTRGAEFPPSELAALAAVAGAIMNLDEFITKE